MLFSKSALLVFTTLAISGTVQAAAIQGPAFHERSIANGNGNALELRALDVAEMGLNMELVERDPRNSVKKASAAQVAKVKGGSSSIRAATSELRKFRASHKSIKNKKTRSWLGRDDAIEERDLEERARKAANVAELRKTLRKVNKHLLTAASQLRQANKREVAGEKRLVGPLPTGVIPTDVLPTGVIPTDVLPTGVIPTDILPTGVIPTDILPTGVIPTDILPTGVIPTDILPTGVIPTDILPTGVIPTDILPTGVIPTDILPTLTLPTLTLPTLTVPTLTVPTLTVPTLTVPTVTLPTTTSTGVPLTGIAAILAAIRALIALIREFIQELIATILEIFTGGSTDTSVLSEVAPGVKAVFGATSGLANDISPNVGAAVDPALNAVKSILRNFGLQGI